MATGDDAPRKGDRVQHLGTRRVGVVEGVERKPWGYELHVQPTTPLVPGMANPPVWWESNKVRMVERASEAASTAREDAR